ncbi:acyltransferase [Rugamonas sp.]|uniref:acyltransferase family protein n=1 Tax=Rugamonas sp. TaxID=1926287 RepID=UPI0025D13A2C|nr:acyltransferase [Rugamonas sp.]
MSAAGRLTALDSLRGLAAMMVVLFHYTTRYGELFGHSAPPSATLPWGYLGVNLFFMISGFVIFMTLEKTVRPMDFIVSRFSRLYPAYWGAVALTWAVVAVLGLPGKEVGPLTALLNLTMLQGLMHVAAVDGVYWTLEVELLFYAGALLLFRLGLLARVPLLLLALFALRLVYFGAARWGHVDLPWLAYHLLILQYIPWFAAGIMVYRLARGSATPRADMALIALAAALLAVAEGWPLALLLAGLSLLLYGAASGRLAWLGQPLLVGLGTMSYTLYLVHENIGWALIRRLEAAGVGPDGAILAALLCSMLLALSLTLLVERPALRGLRLAWRRRQERRAADAAALGQQG